MKSQERVRPALEWIVGVFDRCGVPYQVVGGLAALAHGGSRPLHDIDLYAPLTGQGHLLEAIANHTVWGPQHFRDESWDLVFMKLQFDGMRLEIGDTSSQPRYFDRQRNVWVVQDIDFDASERRTVFGVTLSVIPLHQLLDYKAALGRPVDREDIRDLRGA